MSRFAHFNPEDFDGALDRLIDRADHARKEARENGPAPDELLGVIKDIASAGAQTDTAHLAVQDGRTATVTPFSGDRQARAALSAWLLDGAEIIRRCRVEGFDARYGRDMLAEFATTALLHFDRYQGRVSDPLERDTLRQWIEREIAR